MSSEGIWHAHVYSYNTDTTHILPIYYVFISGCAIYIANYQSSIAVDPMKFLHDVKVLPYCSDSVAWAQASPNLQTLSEQS